MTVNYRALQTITISLASLATSATLVAGRQSTEYDNSANKDPGAWLSGKIRVGTSPTGGQIEIWACTRLDDGATYPDAFGASDADRTVTSANVKNSFLKLLWVGGVDASQSDRDYPFDGIDIAAAFNGLLPNYFTLWVVHSSGVNLNSTAGNHFLKIRPYYFT